MSGNVLANVVYMLMGPVFPKSEAAPAEEFFNRMITMFDSETAGIQ